ncbi:hypothetical protein CPSG_01910 [Coccidioides posadasii str. Silveira]|uniref:Uncharacterized protein n=1 Tax=Coccidioides posadasii (strain RMSCC 757 / Silveira) TaxID=443226 RepID=E9CWS7_COCPS|nr:hypothetical protein CPSG_01910 [Coccidioides posadasii str. Silveira]
MCAWAGWGMLKGKSTLISIRVDLQGDMSARAHVRRINLHCLIFNLGCQLIRDSAQVALLL